MYLYTETYDWPGNPKVHVKLIPFLQMNHSTWWPPWFLCSSFAENFIHFSSYFLVYFGCVWIINLWGDLGKQVGNSSGDKFLVDRLSWNLWCLECLKLFWTSCPDNALWRLGWMVRSIIPKDLQIQVNNMFKHINIPHNYLLPTVNVLYTVCTSSFFNGIWICDVMCV